MLIADDAGDGFHNGIPEFGLFHGVQDHERAISLYTTKKIGLGAMKSRFSAKAIVAWPRWGDPSDEVWVDSKRVESFLAPVPPGSVVAVVSGDAMTAIRPLSITDAGRDAPIRVSLFADQTLAIEMYNYLGHGDLGQWERKCRGPRLKGDSSRDRRTTRSKVGNSAKAPYAQITHMNGYAAVEDF